MLCAVLLLLTIPLEVSARVIYKKPFGATVKTVDGATFGFPGTKSTSIYYKSDPTVYAAIAQVKIPANFVNNFRLYGKSLEESYKLYGGKVSVTVRGNTYIIRGSMNRMLFYSRGILKGNVVYTAVGYSPSNNPKQKAIWKMIDQLKVQ